MDTLSDMVMVVPRPPMMSRKITSCPDISWASTFYFILFYPKNKGVHHDYTKTGFNRQVISKTYESK
jgi:hypothetical protein